MKYFVVEGTFKEPLPVDRAALGKLIQEHQAYLEQGFQQGFILFSGPKPAKNGGFIIMKADSVDTAELYLAKDPLKTAGIQEYRTSEFDLHKCQPETNSWFKD